MINARARLLASTLFVGAAMSAVPAYAQVVPQDQAVQDPASTQSPTNQSQDDGEADGSEVIVTGSLIQNPNLISASPVNVTTADQIELKQSNTAEEVLRELPGVVPNIGSAVNNGNGGAAFVDLRGLGASRNIVLLDGQRIAPSGLLGRVDLNNIPLALIERVDALTGAAVTTYGADAITGVVNFITKRDFTGAELTASNQITQEGDGHIFRVDATIGANFEDGRGNAVLSIGYQQADAVTQGERDFSVFQVDSYSGGTGGSGTSVPSRISGTRGLNANGTINLLPQFSQTGVAADGTPILAPVTGGAANGGVRQINAAGQAVGTFATFNFNPFNIFQTPFERFNIFGQANYELNDEFEVYTRGLFSKNTVSTIVAPSGSFGDTVTANLNNPFLPAALRNQLCAFNTAPTVNGVTATGGTASGQAAYTPRFTPAECTAATTATGRTDPNYREVTFTLNRRATEVGPRISDYQTTIFDYRLGFRGQVTDQVNWDVSGSYGESENIQTIQGYTLTSRFRQGTLVNGTAAAPVCQDTSNGCVPINIFGPEGSITPAAADFLNENSTSINRTSLAQARAVVSGTMPFSSPLATEGVGFALGAEFRKYKAQQSSDLLSKTPGELGGAGGAAPDVDGQFSVYEGYAEIIAPLIEDRPFFESLTLEAGGRYSDYSVRGGAGFDTWTYKVGGSWEPVDSLKFRGNYSRAVRAPNISELFSPFNTVLTNLAVDPCAGAAPTTNANLRAICLAQGAPANSIGSINNPSAAQANITAGGNINVRPETANTWTAGVVFQPDFIPGLSITADYYNIKVKELIGSPLPGDLIAACFGTITAASATDPACTGIRRGPITGALDGSAATTPGLFAPLTNEGTLFTDGVDLIANYRRDLGFAGLQLNFVGNYTANSEFQASSTAINRECTGFYSVNCSFTGSIQPEFQFSQRTTLTFEDIDLSLLWRWIDKTRFEPQQLSDDIAAAVAAGTSATTGCPDPTGTDPNGCVVNPEFRTIPAEHYFDFTVRYNVSDNFILTMAAINLTNNKPKVVGNTIGSTTFNSGNVFPSTYDAVGRRFAVGARLRF
jgi:outer membrane receptor protein involved in Fe transport